MTRKHYKAIASILWQLRCAHNEQTLDEVRLHLVAMLERDNPRFNRDKFIAACVTGKGL